MFFEEVYSIFEGRPPEVNLINEKNNGEAILKIINSNLVNSVHDVSSGGLLTALAEMSISSNIGISVDKPKKLTNSFEYFFGEDQSRYILEIDLENLKNVEKILKENNVFFEKIGATQKTFFEIKKEIKISVKELYKTNNQWYNSY